MRARLPKVLPPCHLDNCFAYRKGRCVLLSTGYSKSEKACPFYKTVEEYNEGKKIYGGERKEYT